ncbi:hypothetical protein KSX_21420 [Ktedonospora formicarum]|uniref:Uncharacterized protein n=2 Tax=Ktedonospora formicarum TaxID=2778364 RepID=A0A8J3HUG6_9CHLR|nr:hypothetical protein KSX_21420 [Ktedonospora formicarum]
MCGVCGTLLMEQAMQTPATTGKHSRRAQHELSATPRRTKPITTSATVTQLVLELQEREPGLPSTQRRIKKTLPMR